MLDRLVDWILNGGDPYAPLWDGLGQIGVEVPAGAPVPNEAIPGLSLMGFGLLLVLLGGIFRRGRDRREDRREEREEDRPLRIRRMPWRRRLQLWWAHKFDQPWAWQLGKLVVYLTDTHGLIVGGSGSGKSTAMVALILQESVSWFMSFMRSMGFWRRRPVLLLTFDRSDPAEEATNIVEDLGVPVIRWRVRGNYGWDVLSVTLKGHDGANEQEQAENILDDIEMIAESVPEGWQKGTGDTGFFRQLMTDAIAEALTEMDREGVPREWNDMIDRCDRIMEADPECPELARRTWVRRLRSLGRVMGKSFGNDFNLADALEEGYVVHISSNSYTSQATTPLVGAMALVQAKLAAEQVKDVWLILEEASFLKARSAILDDLARSMRARGWRIIYLSQDPNDVGSVLQVNFGVAIFMGLGPLATKARQWCADVVKEFPGAFRAAELVLGATIDQLEGYVLWKGKCRDVSLPVFITKPAVHRPAGGPQPASRPGARSGAAEPGARWEVVEIEPGQRSGSGGAEAETAATVRRRGPLAMPAPAAEPPTWLTSMVAYVAQEDRDQRLKQRLNLFLNFMTRATPWDPNGQWIWKAEKGTSGSRGIYGKASYAGKSGLVSHVLFWSWRVMWEREQGVKSDLDRFYEKFPAAERFVWPADGSSEYVFLEALRVWMGRRTKTRERYEIDHCCPGFPNTLCQNPEHHRLITKVRNGQLRHERRTGAGRLAAEREAEVV